MIMGSNITLYLNTDPDTFDWEGPDIFRFESRLISRIFGGSDDLGEILHSSLTADERSQLNPIGHIREEHLVAISPVDLKKTTLKFYDVATKLLNPGSKKTDLLPAGWDAYKVFNNLKRDIAGAVLICERAIEKECQVYVALW